MDELIGKTLRSYDIRSVIGVGGFGVVYRAYQSSVSRDVAIKVISSQNASSERFIQNFEREAKLVARLAHPYIVPIIDFWRDPSGAYIVMRYLGGGSAESSVIQNGPWSLEKTALMLDQIAEALAAAHRNNVVHQDIKAANILLDEQGNAYLSDFGIAKELDQLDDPVDEEGILAGSKESASGTQPTVHGSPEYMAPEQILRMSVDARTDIYSFGVVLYEILTGEKAFYAVNDEALLRKQLYEKVPSLRTKRPDIPPQIDRIIQRATSKHPRNRYADVLEMAREFHQVVFVPSVSTSTEPLPVESTAEPEAVKAEPANPYKGLLAFQEADAENFFGREKLVENLYLNLLRPVEGARFLAVVGASGSGKSSVIRAGLIPMLRKNAPRWFIVDMTPDTDPFAQLTDAILRVAVKADYPYDEVVRRGADGLHTALRHALDEPKRQLVLLIDQFEELFTLTSDETIRRLFIDSLLYALNAPDSQLWVIITLRADFFDRPLAYSGLSELLSKRNIVIPRMDKGELQRAIEKPAEQVGYTFEDGLSAQIVLDVADHINALPLMQFALAHLFEHRDRETRRLRTESYTGIGGIVGALTAQINETFRQLSPDEQLTTQQLFLRLVRMGEGQEDTRRRVTLASLKAAQLNQQHLQTVLDLFISERVLVLDSDRETREPTVEIAHEAVLKNWDTLKGWIDANREMLRVEQQLNQQTAQWLAHDRDRSYLASGARLQGFEELQHSPYILLEEDAKAYLEASIQRRQAAQRLRTIVFAGVAAAAVIFAILFVFALSESQRANLALDDLEIAQATTVAERNRADDESRIAFSRELAIRALLDIPAKDLGLLISAAAVQVEDTDAARNTLFMNLQNLFWLDRLLHGPLTDLRTVAYSPDGRWIAGGGSDQQVYLWDAASGMLTTSGMEHPTEISSLTFDSTAARLLSGGEDGTVRLWSLPDGELLYDVSVGSEISRVAFNSDDALIAVVDEGGRIHLLDGETLEVRAQIEAHASAVTALAFSPDGRTLASGGEDDVIRVWSVDALLEQDAAEPQVLTEHSNWVYALAYSPDGRYLASGGFDHSIIVWDVNNDYVPVQRLTGHGDVVRTVQFSPDGLRLASGGDDARVIVWDMRTMRAVFVSPFESLSAVFSVAFKPDDASSSSLVIGGRSPQAQVWNLAGDGLTDAVETLPQAVRYLQFDPQADSLWVFGNMNDDVETVDIGWRWSFGEQTYTTKAIYREPIVRRTTAAAASGDGRWWANADASGKITLFDAVEGQQTDDALQGEALGIYALAFSADRQWLAVGYSSGQIRLWRRNSEDSAWELQDVVLEAHVDRVMALTFSPDGRYLASGSRDSTVILWTFGGESITHNVLSAHTSAVISLAFSPDASRLISGGRDGLLALWDVAAGSLQQQIRSHTNWVGALTFSHNGEMFVSGSDDHTAILWSIREGVVNQIGKPILLGETVSAVTFSPDDRYLALGGEGGRIRIWRAAPEDWVATACKIANRSLTEGEIGTYLHGFAPPELCLDNEPEL